MLEITKVKILHCHGVRQDKTVNSGLSVFSDSNRHVDRSLQNLTAFISCLPPPSST